MALPSSGQIDLNAMHVEAGNTSATQSSINDTDIRGLLNPIPNSGSQMEFSDWYGASSAPTFKGSVVGNATGNINSLTFANVNTVVAVGDLCIIAVSSDSSLAAAAVSITGMTATKLGAGTSSAPGWLFAYGFRQSGDSSTIGFSTTSDNGAALAGVFAVFSGISSLTNWAGSFQIWGIPDAPNLASASPTKLIVTTAHVDDNYVFMTPPSGYTLARAHRGINNSGSQTSSVAVAYKITSTSQAESPSTFGGTVNDMYSTYTLRFQ